MRGSDPPAGGVPRGNLTPSYQGVSCCMHPALAVPLRPTDGFLGVHWFHSFVLAPVSSPRRVFRVAVSKSRCPDRSYPGRALPSLPRGPAAQVAIQAGAALWAPLGSAGRTGAAFGVLVLQRPLFLGWLRLWSQPRPSRSPPHDPVLRPPSRLRALWVAGRLVYRRRREERSLSPSGSAVSLGAPGP